MSAIAEDAPRPVPSIATKTGVLPALCGERLGGFEQRARVDAGGLEEPGAPDANRVAVDGRAIPSPGVASNAVGHGERRAPRSSRTWRTIASPRGCSEPRSAAAASASSSILVRRAGDADDVGDARPALGQRAGLVEDDRPDATEPLERLGVAEQDPGLGALARCRP